MENGQNIGKGAEQASQLQTEIVRDHTGARHVFPVYDAKEAERQAEEYRRNKDQEAGDQSTTINGYTLEHQRTLARLLGKDAWRS
ncbi:MAG: hypothetical protein A3A51_01945 [Candidatus Levybacteria bacterium RIFCSPLOWO2_01_FULL_39_10]|nr:MAG: hypothetical protein A3A51_01945 [Candidatus Levybacteria bacterium RIFCSPLOWO2_01_FULL_39_10]